MIIVKYLVRETLKSQLAILFILLLIFFSQKLVRILSSAVVGEIPTDLILYLLGLSISEMMQLILPLSLFMSLLMTFGKLHYESEITVMHACGASKIFLIKAAMMLALFTGITSSINVLWIGPWSSDHKNKLLAKAKAGRGIMVLAQRKFQQASNGNLVLFIESVDSSQFYNIFVAQLHPRGKIRPSIIVADTGEIIQYKDGSQVVKLSKGTRFEGVSILNNIRITDFQNCQIIIKNQEMISNSDDSEQMGVSVLWNTDSNLARAELQWRITLVFSVFVMALVVVPISSINSRQGRALPMLLATSLYLLFFLLQTSIKFSASKDKIDPIIWTWIVNGAYLLLALMLNFSDNYVRTRLCMK